MVPAMRDWRALDVLLVAPALIVVLVQDRARPFARRLSSLLHSRTPLGRWHAGMARLPPAAALPLFLIPEACSRGGTLLSAWVLLHGEGWRALAVYAGAKLFAGSTAWWIYSACRPALLRWRAFFHLHAMAAAVGRAMTRRRGDGRFTTVLARLRSSRLGQRGEIQR